MLTVFLSMLLVDPFTSTTVKIVIVPYPQDYLFFLIPQNTEIVSFTIDNGKILCAICSAAEFENKFVVLSRCDTFTTFSRQMPPRSL